VGSLIIGSLIDGCAAVVGGSAGWELQALTNMRNSDVSKRKFLIGVVVFIWGLLEFW
jgi:hypothetical protein